ncbi:MAG: YHS domain-containing protein [Candidatus Omnitrophota bacterium]
MCKKVLVLISFLCLVCMGGIGFAQEMGGESQGVSEETQEYGICPVMGGRASKDYFSIYNGKVYYFCCEGCVEEFNNNPEQYIPVEESTVPQEG